MKLMKSFDESLVSSNVLASNESHKNGSGDGQNKKPTKKTPLTEKPSNVTSAADKRQIHITSTSMSDRQPQRTLAGTSKNN